MSISGLAITLTSGADDVRATIEALRERPEIEVGERNGRRLAITSDTSSIEQDRALLDWIGALPGVEHVDVVFVGFEENPT